MMEMDHPGIVALICVALLIWIRSPVPYHERTRVELRLVELWHRGAFAALLFVRYWLMKR